MLINRFANVSVRVADENDFWNIQTGMVLSYPIYKLQDTFFIVEGFKELVNLKDVISSKYSRPLLIDTQTGDVLQTEMSSLRPVDCYSEEIKETILSSRTILSNRISLHEYNKLLRCGLNMKDAYLAVKYYESNPLPMEDNLHIRKYFSEIDVAKSVSSWFSELDSIGPDNEYTTAAINFSNAVEQGVDLKIVSNILDTLGVDSTGAEESIAAIQILQANPETTEILVQASKNSVSIPNTLVALASCVSHKDVAKMLGVNLEV